MIDSEENVSLILERQNLEINDFARFRIGERKFSNQFCNIYIARLAALREILIERAKTKWGREKNKFNFGMTKRESKKFTELKFIGRQPILQIDSLSNTDGDKGTIILVGTLYKHQELKPSILKDLSEELQILYQSNRTDYSSDKDKLFLEDETMRTKLLGNHPNPRETVTGIVCAVLGRATENGDFWVEDWCFSGCCVGVSTSLSLSARCKGKLLLVSGFDLVNNADNMSFELLSEWISGLAGNSTAQRDEALILQVVIAGNSIRAAVETFKRKDYESKKGQPSSEALETILATRRFDSFVRSIVENCSVIVLPGQFDPSNHSLPQQPLHPCMLPQSSRYKTLRAVTNPWIGKIGDRIVAGSSGQPIEDITKVAGLDEATSLDWLERTLIWRHFAPTAPDTLPAYPYFNEDPFVIKECPEIYFTGNMHEFATKLYIGEEGQKVRLICIPKFSKTETAVIVDLNSLEVSPISFGSNQ